MDWTPIALIVFAALMAAELLVFRVVFPPRTIESAISRTVDVLAWVFVVLLLLVAFAWIILA